MSASKRPIEPRSDEALGSDLAKALPGRREAIGWTLGRMAKEVASRAHQAVDETTLASIEAGNGTGTNRSVLGAVAELYDVSLDQLPATRRAIEIRGGAIVIGDIEVDFYSRHIDDVLVAFLEAVRRARGNEEVEVTGFRRIDIEVLSRHLDCSVDVVLEHLAHLVGASDAHPSSMAKLYHSGAAMIPSGAVEEPVAEPSSRLADLLTEAD